MLAISCKNDLTLTLVLHTPQQVDNSIVLSWEQPEISGFKYYMVMCASDGQNFKIINDILTPASEAFNKEICTFTDNSYPLENDTLYYKVMAVGDKTVSSKNILFCNENKIPIIKGRFTDMYFIEEENKISVVGYGDDYQDKLQVFDLQSGDFLSYTKNVYMSSSCCWLTWGHYNGKTEAYHYPSNNTIVCYDAATTQKTATITIPDMCYDPYTTNNKGIIYIHRYYLYLINRATNNYTQYQPTYDIYWPDYLYYNSKDNKLYSVDCNYGEIQTFNLNENGSVINDEIFQTNNKYSTPIFIENSSLFIVNINEENKILDMNTKTYHNTDLSSYYYYDIRAILANNSIYVTNGTNKIYKISTVDYKITQTITLRATPKKLFVVNGYLYYFGEYNYNSYILDKIKL